MISEEPDLCRVIIQEMSRLEFSQRSIDTVTGSRYFQNAIGLDPLSQKTQLTVLINHIFTMGPSVVPYQIRLGLCMATDTIAWITDLKLTLLPFLKENEDAFFV